MDRGKLEKLRGEAEELRFGVHRATEFQRLARRLGREIENRGKHPMWVSSSFSYLRPLAIPDHGGKDIPKGTAKAILNVLDDDIEAWDAWVTEREREASESKQHNGNGGGRS